VRALNAGRSFGLLRPTFRFSSVPSGMPSTHASSPDGSRNGAAGTPRFGAQKSELPVTLPPSGCRERTQTPRRSLPDRSRPRTTRHQLSNDRGAFVADATDAVKQGTTQFSLFGPRPVKGAGNLSRYVSRFTTSGTRRQSFRHSDCSIKSRYQSSLLSPMSWSVNSRSAHSTASRCG
jgi:hypothetical protein